MILYSTGDARSLCSLAHSVHFQAYIIAIIDKQTKLRSPYDILYI